MLTEPTVAIGVIRDWPLYETLEDLGLGFDALDGVLVDKPEDWSPGVAAELALATHAVVSALIGTMGAGREGVSAALRALAGMCAVEVVSTDAKGDAILEPSPWPDWGTPGTQELLRTSTYAGWGSARGPWRRLSGRTFNHASRVTAGARVPIRFTDD